MNSISVSLVPNTVLTLNKYLFNEWVIKWINAWEREKKRKKKNEKKEDG